MLHGQWKSNTFGPSTSTTTAPKSSWISPCCGVAIKSSNPLFANVKVTLTCERNSNNEFRAIFRLPNAQRRFHPKNPRPALQWSSRPKSHNCSQSQIYRVGISGSTKGRVSLADHWFLSIPLECWTRASSWNITGHDTSHMAWCICCK